MTVLDPPDGAVAETMASPRDHLLVAVNGDLHRIDGRDAFLTLSTFLRERLRLVGTKIVCSEGDCGACSVLVGEPEGDAFRYRPIDSCICFLYQLDRCHVITVEGLSGNGTLHPAQTAMAQSYGSQCGFCTPGFVIALAALTEQARQRGGDQPEGLDPSAVRLGLSGNLCRCTGYVQIVEAALSIDPQQSPTLGELYDDRSLLELFERAAPGVRLDHEGRSLVVAGDLADALSSRARCVEAQVVAGATDVGVRYNKGKGNAASVLHLRSDLVGLSEVELCTTDRGRVLRLGAAARWSAIEPMARQVAPELARILELFGAPQIRNAGTVGGNLVNASPIADSLPFFYACEATLELRSERGDRTVPIADFYRGYKDLELNEDELLVAIEVPLPEEQKGELVRLIKVSRRRDLDISTFTAALWLGQRDGRIETARLAMGGVGPTVLRLPDAERRLVGAVPSLDVFENAGETAAREIRPISDVRGRDSYRRLLARNALIHLFHDLFHERIGEPT